MSILQGIESVVSMLSKGVETGYNIYNAERNYKNQLEMQQYEKDMQQTLMQREDNAVQRRTADMRAAGLNPVLAAGQSAQASAPIKVTTPIHADIQMPDVMGLMTQKLNIDNLNRQNQILKLQEQKNALENERFAWDTKYWKSRNLPTNMSGTIGQLTGAQSVIDDMLDRAKKYKGIKASTDPVEPGKNILKDTEQYEYDPKTKSWVKSK